MKNTERVSYIRGLAEGLELDENKKEVKVLNAVIDLLDDMALSMSELEDNVNDISDQVDAVDEDLGSLEDDFYDDGEDEDEDEDEDEIDEDEKEDESGEDKDSGEEYDEDDDYFEVTCPNCHEKIRILGDVLDEGEMVCPNCGETLELDLDDYHGEESDGGEKAAEEKKRTIPITGGTDKQ